MSETRFQLAETIGIDLSSRARAASLRAQVEALGSSDSLAVIDFEGVRTLSDSFADEIFGVLLQRYGQDWLFSRVKLVNARPSVQISILEAIAARLYPHRRRRLRQPA
jgi:hypothetical protein